MHIDDYQINGDDNDWGNDDSSIDYSTVDMGESDTSWGDSDDAFLDDVVRKSKSDNEEYHPSFESKTDDSNKEWYDYYQKKMENALKEENYHIKKAQEALNRGDQTGYKDHMDRAQSWHNDAAGFKRSRDIYKK